MRIFLLLCTLGLFACDFQDDPLVTTKETIRSVPQVDVSDFQRSFERYLELYVVENSDPNVFDTLVRYKKMYELSSDTNSAQGREYQELRETVNDYFAGLNYESLNKEEKKAHLINAYNFFVMDYMARNYSTVTSIVAAGEMFSARFLFNSLIKLFHWTTLRKFFSTTSFHLRKALRHEVF